MNLPVKRGNYGVDREWGRIAGVLSPDRISLGGVSIIRHAIGIVYAGDDSEQPCEDC